MMYVNKPKEADSIFKVVFTEYERGWGSKHWDTYYFDDEDEARQYAEDYNRQHNNKSTVPDWYVRADFSGPSK